MAGKAKKVAKKAVKKKAVKKAAVKKVAKKAAMPRFSANVARAAAGGQPSAAAIARARQVVMAVLRARFGNMPYPDDKKLSTLRLNAGNLAGIAQNIRQNGVPVNDGPIVVCRTVGDLVMAVARAIIRPGEEP